MYTRRSTGFSRRCSIDSVILAITIGIDPEAVAIGPWSVRWYGLLYIVAIGAGILVAQRVVARLGTDMDTLWDLLPVALIAGLLGGRLYYMVQNDFGSYVAAPLEILAIWNGGMAFFGAVIGVTVAIALFAWNRRAAVWPLLDVVAVIAAVGQPIGRIGNVINGDVIVYPTSVPWATAYTHERAFVPELGVPYHPAAAYALLAGLALLVVMAVIVRLGPRAGTVFATYLVGYSVTQFVVFFWRANSITLFGLKQAQLTAIVVGLVGLAILSMLYRGSGQQAGPQTPIN